jgi:hypothetical protein
MTIEERIPQLTDNELENLRSNAVRLSTTGAPAQKAEAARLLPIITTAIASRRASHDAELAERKRIRQAGMAEARARKKAVRKTETAAN